MAQHATLTPDRWSGFTFDQQILMIANEMHRAGKLIAPDDGRRRANAYERVLQLTDLTIQTVVRPTARRELLRWRDLASALYVQQDVSAVDHHAAWRCLLRFTPQASRQLTTSP
jgi:hypothetical protein